MFESLVSADIFTLLLVFARLGAAFVMLPGFSEVYVAPRIRLIIAVGLTLVVTPIVGSGLPTQPASNVGLFLLIGSEVMIGLVIGALARFILASLHVAGTVISFQSSLSNANIFDPANAQQGSLVGTFLSVLGVLLIFVSNLHHQMLMALVDSYLVFVPGAPLPLSSFSELSSTIITESFRMGLQLAAPFLLVGVIFYAGLGLLNRLMPQVQVFFIAIPLQVFVSFSVLALTLSAAMIWFLERFETLFTQILAPV